jgi:nitroreductase/formate hydrogenlyase subunit 6/NADH:ubiquinone oxidoreductase subunit I
MTGIIIEKDLCTQCGICAEICPMHIITTAPDGFPDVTGTAGLSCIRCGHCEASCPSAALTLDFALEDMKVKNPAPFNISEEAIAYYLKSRRSVRHFIDKPVPQETIRALLDCARYAPSGVNMQPVRWLVVHDPAEVRRLAGLTIDWMQNEARSESPMMPPLLLNGLVSAWGRGSDPVCRGAPHLLIAHIPDNAGTAPVDGIIAVTYADIAAPAFGLGTCWAGFLSIAAARWKPLRDALSLPPGRTYSYALMCGYPRYSTYRIPRRNPLSVTFR